MIVVIVFYFLVLKTFITEYIRFVYGLMKLCSAMRLYSKNSCPEIPFSVVVIDSLDVGCNYSNTYYTLQLQITMGKNTSFLCTK